MKQRHGRLVHMACLFSMLTTAWGAALDIPVCKTPPKLDADLDDVCWRQATKRTGFHKVLKSAGAPAEVQTTVWLCRDDAWLYVAFRCDDPKAFSVQRAVTERDRGVTLDDCVEVFLDPGTGATAYAHVILSAGNTQADQWCEGKRRSLAWDLPWRSAARADRDLNSATGWSAELAIPLAPLQQRAGREPWRMNLCRTRRTVSPAEHTSLAPLPPRTGFHAPGCFLPLTGLTGFAAKAVFGPMLDGIELKPLRIEGGRQFYQLEVGLAERGGGEGAVEVVVQDQPKNAAGNRADKSVKLWAKGKRKVSLELEVADLSPRSAWVGLRLPGADFWLTKTSVSGLDALSPLDAYLDRDYYTAEAVARVHAGILVNAQTRQTAGLGIRVALGGKTMGQVSCEAPEVTVPLALAAIPVGTHTVNVSLLNRDRLPLGSARLQLIKRPMAEPGANELKIDRHNRCLVLNGKSFFPVGAVGQWYRGRFDGHIRALFERQYRYCREAGFNLLVDWAGYGPETPLEDCRAHYDLALANGMRVIGRPYSTSTRKKGWRLRYNNPEFADVARRVIDRMAPYLTMCRTHPAVIGYYHFDEPQPWINIDDLLIDAHDKIRRICPHQLVYMSLTRYIHNPSWFDRMADLLGAHNYWYVDRPDTLPAQSDWFHQVDGHARRAHSPTMHMGILQISGDFTIASAAEQRAQTYLMLVANARSVLYFVLPLTHRDFIRTQRVLSNEVHQLAPALMTRDLAQEQTFQPETAYVPRGSSGRAIPIVQTVLKRHPEGGQVLLAVNSYRKPLTVRFTVSTLSANSTVRRMFGDRRRCEVAERSFTDAFEPLGTRAYRLDRTAAVAKETPARIHLGMSGPAVMRETETVPMGVNLLAKPRNLLSNSSFERACLPGQPTSWESLTWGYAMPDERACGQDDRNPFHGRYCMRVTRPADAVLYDPRTIHAPMSLPNGRTYTLSAYLRADEPGVRVSLYLNGIGKAIKLTTGWKRHTLTKTIDNGAKVYVAVYYYSPAGSANAYVDAVQLKEGDTPTEYEPN